MRKLLWPFLIGMMLLMSGCGSNDFDVAGVSNEDNITNGTDTDNNTNDTTSLYKLMNATSPVVVQMDQEAKVISVNVVDDKGVGVRDQSVSISVVNGYRYGAITSASIVKTDESGRASFSYTAPTDVSSVNGEKTEVTLRLVGTDQSEKVEIIFDKTQSLETVSSKPFPVIDNSQKIVTIKQNSDNAEIKVRILEEGTYNPYTQGTVKVELPSKVADGVDVGSFTTYEVEVGSDGYAKFTYNAPQNLQALVDSGESNATFSFFHVDNPTKKAQVTVVYEPTSGEYIPADYLISTTSEDGNQTMGLKQRKQFTALLKDDQGNTVKDNNVTKVTLHVKNSLVGKLLDQQGNEVEEISFTGTDATGSKTFSIQTYTYSGLLPVEITYEFKDANGDDVVRTYIMNVVVFSGPPTAISIAYAGVEVNSTSAKYIEKFAVTVTDAYNNPVNTRPFVAVGAMVEYAVDGSSTTGERDEDSPRLWHGRLDTLGKLEAVSDNFAQFTADAADTFKYVDMDNDKLVVFGGGYVYEALGKWDIGSNDQTTIQLKDKYYGQTREDLYFAVGHNNRQDLCANDGREYVGNMKAGQYQLDAGGHALLEFEYDYHLTGKDIMVWVNLTGFQADNNHEGRIGEAIKHTLRGAGFTHVPENGCTLEKGESGTCRFAIHHEQAPEWYHNGHFSYAIASGSTCRIIDVRTSNTEDARNCDSWAAYVEYDLQAPDDKSCTFDIDRVTTSSEFYKSTW